MFEIIEYSIIALVFFIIKNNSLSKSGKFFSTIVLYVALIAVITKSIALFILK